MHMVIYALVEASTEDEALAAGKAVFSQLVGADPHANAAFDRSRRNSKCRIPLRTFKYQAGDTRECIDG
ncbi:hypothetical protein KZ498_14545 [Haloarcula sp. 1CSR25-25]|nr:hypothetical protein [Haloarcula sp. 1CSR25-25]